MDSNPGEYVNAFDGRFGGLWRQRGRMPSKVCGLTFTAYGFDVSGYYRRLEDSYSPECKWIFDGVDEECFGDYGLLGGGAAGLEIDRYDIEAGTPHHAHVLATSEGHSDLMMQVNEEIHYHVARLLRRRGPQPVGALRPRLLQDPGRRRRVQHRIDRVVREPVAQRLRQRRVTNHRERRAQIRLADTIAMSGLSRDPSRAAHMDRIAETEIAPLLLDERRRAELIEEHRRQPIGRPARTGERGFRHGPDVVKVLDFFRRAPVDGKLVLIADPDGGGWRIARIAKRGVGPVPVSGEGYATREKAEHAVFLKRVEEFLETWSSR